MTPSMNALTLTVVRTESMGPALKRLILTGNGLARIPQQHAGLHIKLFFKTKIQTCLTLPSRDAMGKIQWPANDLKPIARTYSIAGYDRIANELAVDFVLHEAPGPAADFARSAQPGDELGFAGPGPVTLFNPDCQHHILSGDLSAVPALAAVAKVLPESATPTVFLELPQGVSISDIRTHYFPSTRTELITFQSTQPSAQLHLDTIAQHIREQIPTQTSLTIAGEHSSVVFLRNEARKLGYPKANIYAVPYWRHTLNEETYHAERHDVMDN